MGWSRTYDGAEPQRVNKWLAQAGVCSRREAEALIEAGQVRIEGEVVRDPGRKILPGQTLALTDRAEAGLAARFTAVLHKPLGYVSGQPEGDQVPAVRLVRRANQIGPGPAPAPDASLAPLGRLDQDSRGLLLLSDDGVLAKAVIGPESQMEKEYLVAVEGDVSARKIALLRHGLMLDGRALKPAAVRQEQDGRLRMILREGRNRQIRRMAELVDLWVVDLIRVRIGAVRLGELAEGRWRALTAQERAGLLGGG
jgi:23S rRNA pseudouridine2604 synthase